jgi:chaperonin GroEL (HSP60 family)
MICHYGFLIFSIFSQFIEEAERSLHDAIMIVRRAMKNSTVVAGGGAIDVCLHSKCGANLIGL